MFNKLKRFYPFKEIARVIDLHFARMDRLEGEIHGLRGELSRLREDLAGMRAETRRTAGESAANDLALLDGAAAVLHKLDRQAGAPKA
jgi:hypothetical protein